MSGFVAKLATTLRRPAIGLEYAGFALNKAFRAGEVVRNVYGVRLGDFNGFSEYHSVVHGVSPDEMAFLANHSFGEGTIIDVGANLGLFSLVLNNRFPDRKIIALEPSPSTCAALKNNVARNYATNVECHQIAVADHDGFVTFAAREHARANASISTKSAHAPERTIRVPCTTLDTFCKANGMSRIAMLKVDVEGFEALVFRGAENVLAKARPGVIYFEICPGLTRDAGFDPAEPAAYIAARGYSLHRIANGGGVEPVDATAASKVVRVENWIGIDSQ